MKNVITYPGTELQQVTAILEALNLKVHVARRLRDVYAMKWDAVVLLGGGDFAPAFYGQLPNGSKPPDLRRDAVEWALLRTALATGRQIFGICRGHQFLTVALGGSLIQHIPDEEHGYGTPHPIIVESPLAEHLPETFVNSYHHQAVDVAPFGLDVVAVAPDGIIEAVHRPGYLGVQFHPEMLIRRNPDWMSLFEWFKAGLT